MRVFLLLRFSARRKAGWARTSTGTLLITKPGAEMVNIVRDIYCRKDLSPKKFGTVK